MTNRKGRGGKRWLKVGAGWCLLVVGVAGLFLPVIQGLVCIASGLTLLSTEYRWAATCLDWVKGKIGLRHKQKSAQHQPETLTHLSAGHALGEHPSSKEL
jgi:Putative transmembrane protein (PGPGW)